MSKAVAVLDTMWDWEARTTSAGYAQAPRYFRINRRNFSGGRVYSWVEPRYDHLLVTDACKELVSSASQKGTPDPQWLAENLLELAPFQALLVCGNTAQRTFDYCLENGFRRACVETGVRVLYVPHPAARGWTRRGLEQCRKIVQLGEVSIRCRLVDGRLRLYPLYLT